MSVGELVEELVAAVGDHGGEVGAIRQLEGQDRRGITGMQALQLGHHRALPRRRAEVTWLWRRQHDAARAAVLECRVVCWGQRRCRVALGGCVTAGARVFISHTSDMARYPDRGSS